MEDLELLNKFIEERELGNSAPQKNAKGRQAPQSGLCSHENITTKKNITICEDCGEELEDNAPFEKEWRFYGNNDNRFSADPSRCQIRKPSDRNIDKDVEGLGLSHVIISQANELYQQVTEGDIHRGARRRGIILGCIHRTYSMTDNPQTFDTLAVLFNIERKAGLKGVKYVNMRMPAVYRKNVNHMTHQDLVRKTMKEFEAKPEQIQEVLDIFPKIKDKSVMLNGSRPPSLAAGLIYYWIEKNKKPIAIKEFASKVGLSEITIKKIFNEIRAVLEGKNQGKARPPKT